MVKSELPVPDQLEKQLSKCKAVRESTHYKSREKTPAEIEASKAKFPALPTPQK